jgi:hypothetical protein
MKRYSLETVVFDDGSVTTSIKHANEEIHASVSRLNNHENTLTVSQTGAEDRHQLSDEPFGSMAQKSIATLFSLFAGTIVKHYEHDFRGKFGDGCPWCGIVHAPEPELPPTPEAVEGAIVGRD